MNRADQQSSLTAYRVEEWQAAAFAQNEKQWSDLLSRSSADPLFMSWDWQYLWWQAHKSAFSLQLRILAVYRDQKLVGLAPLTMRTVVHKKLFSTSRLEISGHLWREPDGVVSEYQDLIIDRDHELAVLEMLANYIQVEVDFGEIVFANTRPESHAAKLLNVILSRLQYGYIRVVDEFADHTIDLSDGLERYAGSLSSDARRKMFSHRNRLEQASLRMVGRQELSEAFDMIESYLDERWGRQVYGEVQKSFYREFANRMADKKALRFSIMSDSSQPISVMYNVSVCGSEYNLQSAFRRGAISGVTPTYIHFGFSAERAIGSGDCRINLLAGRGKVRDYKKDIATHSGEISTRQLLCGPASSTIYMFYDWLIDAFFSGTQRGSRLGRPQKDVNAKRQ